MTDLDIIIPTLNESENIDALIDRVISAFDNTGVSYRVIIVDDHSTDQTYERAQEARLKYISPSGYIFIGTKRKKINFLTDISILKKEGIKGKAFSLIQGITSSNSSYVAIIDGDLQYPPEALPSMYKTALKSGMVIAERKDNKTSFIRRYGSRIKRLIFGKFLHGIDLDIQAGLKVFKRNIFDQMDQTAVTSWTFDLSLVKVAHDLGYSIASYDITFEDRIAGKSKVNIIKTSWEIALNSIKVWFNYDKAYSFDGTHDDLNRGLFYHGKKFITHSGLNYKESALITFTPLQKKLLISGLISLIVLFTFSPLIALRLLAIILTLLYFSDMVFSYFLISKGLDKPSQISFTKRELESIDESGLPKYTILCPLYKEASVLPHFISAIKKIDWPKEKLEVFLLLEEDDVETQNKAYRIELPTYIRTLIVPKSQPKTKPKACNYGLYFATGEYIVIYDAEDRPDPLQLKKAYKAFEKSSEDIVCLQSKLNYYNTNQNILTRLFTAEYSLWFDLILPGLQSLHTIIPLGGTSNHFKTEILKSLHGWDPFNVTEDCDLGVRLFKKGFKTAIIDSTTYEEANSKLHNWVRQRSRWIKGYLQTFLVHSRNFGEFYKDHKHHAFLFTLIIGLRMTFMIINPIMWITTLLYFTAYPIVGAFIESIYHGWVFYLAILTMVFGNFLYFYQYMIGLARRNTWEIVLYVFFVPFYWLIASYASIISFYQLLKKPYFWEKTHHGLHLVTKDKKQKASVFAVRFPSFAFPEITLAISFSRPKRIISEVINKLTSLSALKRIKTIKVIIQSTDMQVGQIKLARNFMLVSTLISLGVLRLLPFLNIYFDLSDRLSVIAFTPFILISLMAVLNYGLLTRYYAILIGGVSLAVAQILVLTKLLNLDFAVIGSVFGLFGLIYLTTFLLFHVIYITFSSSFVVWVKLINSRKLKRTKPAILIYNWRDTKHVWAGGAEIYLHELATKWVKKGHKVTIFCSSDGKNPTNDIVDGVEVIRRGGFSTVYIWAFFYYVFKFRGDYDVIIDSENGIPFFTPFYSRLPKILLIHHVHQDVFARHLNLPQRLLANFLEAKLMPFAYRQVKKITVSESSRADMQKIGLGMSNDIDIVSPGIEPKKFTKRVKTPYPSLLYLGRLKAYKSIDTLLKSLPAVLRFHPKVVLTIAGFGEKRKSLEKLTKKLNLNKNVRFVGKVSEKRKATLMAKSWVFVYPSTMEGWGIAAVEASASGTAVIASNTKGLRDSVNHMETGILVTPKNSDELAKKINILISNSKLRNKLAQNGIMWSRNFTWEKGSRKFLQILTDEISKTSLSGEVAYAEN